MARLTQARGWETTMMGRFLKIANALVTMAVPQMPPVHNKANLILLIIWKYHAARSCHA
jgi:hypothetical protein